MAEDSFFFFAAFGGHSVKAFFMRHSAKALLIAWLFLGLYHTDVRCASI